PHQRGLAQGGVDRRGRGRVLRRRRPFSAAPSALADPKPPPRAHAYNVTLSCTTIDGLSDGLFAWVEGGMGGCGSDTFGTVSFTRGSPVSLGLGLAAKSPRKYQPNLPKAEVDAGFALQS